MRLLETSILMNSTQGFPASVQGERLRVDTKMNLQPGRAVELLECMMGVASSFPTLTPTLPDQ